MNCQEALSLLYDIIDNEATDIDKEEVRQHLSKCHDCSGIYRIEESLQRFLTEKLKETDEDPSPALENLKDKVRKEIYRQSEDRDGAPHATPSRLAARTLAIAAVVVLMLSATFFAAGVYEHYRDFRDLETAHLNGVNGHDEFSDPANIMSAQTFVRDSLDLRISPTVAKFALVGASLTNVGETVTGQFLYRRGEDNVSLFVCRDCDMEIPSGTVRDDQGYCLHDCDACHLCYRAMGSALLVVAADNAEIDLRQFISQQTPALAAAF